MAAEATAKRCSMAAWVLRRCVRKTRRRGAQNTLSGTSALHRRLFRPFSELNGVRICRGNRAWIWAGVGQVFADELHDLVGKMFGQEADFFAESGQLWL